LRITVVLLSQTGVSTMPAVMSKLLCQGPSDALLSKLQYPDLMNLVGLRRNIPLEAGKTIMWNNRLMYGTMSTPVYQCIEYGHYVGFDIAEHHPRYEETCGVDEMVNRLNSYKKGHVPLLWPSFDKVEYVPKRAFMYHNTLMKSYLIKFPDVHPMRGKHQLKNGNIIDCLVPPVVVGYEPPALTELGKKQLGLKEWSVKKEARVLDIGMSESDSECDFEVVVVASSKHPHESEGDEDADIRHTQKYPRAGVCLHVCLYVSLYFCFSVCMYTRLTLSACMQMYMDVCLILSSIYLSIYQLVHTVCAFTYHLKRNQSTEYEDCFSPKEISNADA